MEQQYCYHCMKKLDGSLPCPECGWNGMSDSEPHQLPAGTILKERYLLGEVLGQGGFGITYIGRDLSQDRRIAVKEYYPGNCAIRDVSSTSMITVSGSRQEKVLEKGKEKMLQEAEVLRQLKNVSGIVDVFDFFETNNTVYIVMEYLDGSDLRTILDSHTIPSEEIFRKILPLMQSLAEVHSRNLIHRDISPDNIMMLKDGTLKLMDFGAARESNDQDDHSISVILKSGYAPVEQYSGKGSQGPWTDIYALCATMYKCITGKTPEESLQRLLQDNVQWPSELGCVITPQQEDILKKGMAVKKDDRYSDLSSLLSDLQLADSDETISKEDDVTVSLPPRRPPPGQDPEKDKRKPNISFRRFLTIIGILAVLAGGGVLGYRMSPAYTEHLMQTGEVYHIALAPEKGNEDAFDENTAILKERLDISAGKRKYRIRKTGTWALDLYLPVQAFGDADPDEVLRHFLTCDGRMYLADRTYDESQQDPVVIEPSYVDHIDSDYGAVSGFTVPKEIWEDPEYEYLTIHLNKEGRKKLGKFRSENAIISSDVLDRTTLSGSRYQVFYSCFGQDPFPDPIHIMNIVKNRSFPAYPALMEYMFTHEPMKGHLEYALEDPIRWEAGTKEDAGDHQRAESAVPENSMTLILRNEDTEVTPGKRVDAMDIIKKRCDALGDPYAFGVLKADKNSFAVKIGPEHVNPAILNLISVYRLDPCLLIGNRILEIASEDIRMEETDGDTCLCVDISEDEVRNTIQGLLSSDPGLTCRFSVKGIFVDPVPFVQETLENAFDGKTLRLTRSCYNGKDLSHEENAWMPGFLMTVLENASSNLVAYRSELQSDPLSAAPKWSYGMMDHEYIQNLEEAIQDLVPDAQLETCNDLSDNVATLTVRLHLDLNGELPEKALKIAQMIYELADLDHSIYNTLDIYPTDTEPRTKERMSISFQRHLSQDPKQDGVDMVSGRFFGGRLERYKDQFRSLLTSSDFYRRLGKNYQQYQSRDGSSGWLFGATIYF